MTPHALVFGAGGALGTAIHAKLAADGFQVFTAGSQSKANQQQHIQLQYDQPLSADTFSALPDIESVVWAQGLNCSDTISDFEPSNLEKLWQANVVFIASSLSSLLAINKIQPGSRLVIVSSIWQLETRPGKLSYTISKSALQGLVKSCALDLGERGILINAVLPGVVDTPMTRYHLSDDQIATITSQTALRRLPEPTDIAETVAFLVSRSNRAITGQFLTVDGGFIGFKHS